MIRSHGDDGFSLVEILAATVVLMVVVISFSSVLLNSLNVALRTRQELVAASLASDVVENAKALGLAALGKVQPGASCVPRAANRVPVSTSASTIGQCFTIMVDDVDYRVMPALSVGPPDRIAVTVTWSGGRDTYTTATLVGE